MPIRSATFYPHPFCLTLLALITALAPASIEAQVPGKRRVAGKMLKAARKTHSRINLHAPPSHQAKATIAAANAAVVAAAAKAAWDSFYQTNDREAFHTAMGETRVSNAALLRRLNFHIQENFYLDEYVASVSLTQKQHRSFIALPLKEVYLTRSGADLIGNLYYEAPDDNLLVDSVLPVMKPFNASVGERIVPNPAYAEYVAKLAEKEKADKSSGNAINDAFIENLRSLGLKVGLSDEDRQKILSLSHSSSFDSIPPSKIVAYNAYPKNGLVRSVFEDADMKSLSFLRVHFYGHRTDKFGEDHLFYYRSFVVDRNEIAQIKNWNKINFADFVHYE